MLENVTCLVFPRCTFTKVFVPLSHHLSAKNSSSKCADIDYLIVILVLTLPKPQIKKKSNVRNVKSIKPVQCDLNRFVNV